VFRYRVSIWFFGAYLVISLVKIIGGSTAFSPGSFFLAVMFLVYAFYFTRSQKEQD